MRAFTCLVGFVTLTTLVASIAACEPNIVAKSQVSAERLKGIKAAVADIESGRLKQREFPMPNPAWFQAYVGLLKEECGVEWETVDPARCKGNRAEVDGYNDVMRAEIEFRFGRGILDKLQEQAERDTVVGCIVPRPLLRGSVAH